MHCKLTCFWTWLNRTRDTYVWIPVISRLRSWSKAAIDMHIPGMCFGPCFVILRCSLCCTNVRNSFNKNGPLNFNSCMSISQENFYTFFKGSRRKGEGPSAPVFRQSVAHSLFTKSSTLSSIRSLRAECANTAFATESTHPPASARAIFCRSWSTSLVQLTNHNGDEMEIYSICVVNY